MYDYYLLALASHNQNKRYAQTISPFIAEMWQWSPYKILGLNRSTTEQDIKQAYYSLMKKFHPDLSKDGNDDALEIAKLVNRAYEFLLSPEEKHKRDIARQNRPDLTDNQPYKDESFMNQFVVAPAPQSSDPDAFMNSIKQRRNEEQRRNENTFTTTPVNEESDTWGGDFTQSIKDWWNNFKN